MKKTILIVTVNNRIEQFKKLLSSIYIRGQFKEYHIAFTAQMYSQEEINDMEKFIDERTTGFYLPKGEGPHSARIHTLNNFDSDYWINLDDDMEMTKQTNFDPMIDAIRKDPSIGFISGNWGRTRNIVDKKVLQHKFVKQNIVYTGGGLAYSNEVANIIRSIANLQYLFDDIEWSMRAFINGYENYRYLGSVCIHRVVTKGGRENWVRQGKKFLNDDRLVKLIKANNNKYEDQENNYKIPDSSCLTKQAHILHKMNRSKIRNKI